MRNRCTNVHALLLRFDWSGARSRAVDAARAPSYRASATMRAGRRRDRKVSDARATDEPEAGNQSMA
jgi:hypothetical protein